MLKLMFVFVSFSTALPLFSRQVIPLKDVVTAARQGQKTTVARFLREGFSINATDEDGRTALHHLSALGAIKGVNLLLEHDADVFAKDTNGLLPFDEAVETRQFESAAVLLKEMVGINGRDQQGWTPLNWGVLSGDAGLVQRLLDVGASVLEGRSQSALDVAALMEDETMIELLTQHIPAEDRDLIWAIQHRKGTLIEVLLKHHSADPNTLSESGDSALTMAVQLKLDGVVQTLLTHGADPHLGGKLNGKNTKTPLVWAIEWGYADTVRVLYDHIIKYQSVAPDSLTEDQRTMELQVAEFFLNEVENDGIDDRDRTGWTPLDWVVFSGDTELARALIRAGAEILTRNLNRPNALQVAMNEKNTEMIELLIQHLPQDYRDNDLIDAINARGNDNRTWLLELLLTHYKKDPNTVNAHGDTALMWATHEGNEEAVELLLAHGADPNIVDPRNNSWTALMWAVETGSARLVEILLKNGADPHIVNKDGDTALSLATKRVRSLSHLNIYDGSRLRDLIALLKGATPS